MMRGGGRMMEKDRRVFPILVLLLLTSHQCDKEEECMTSTCWVTVFTDLNLFGCLRIAHKCYNDIFIFCSEVIAAHTI